MGGILFGITLEARIIYIMSREFKQVDVEKYPALIIGQEILGTGRKQRVIATKITERKRNGF